MDQCITSAEGPPQEEQEWPHTAPKPMLSPEAQIEHLKARGVTFELCDEQEALAYLRTNTYYYKLAAYRVLFPKRIGGAHDGEYSNLNFAYLRDLDQLDRQLRRFLLPMTLEVEHAAKVRLMREIEQREPNGYTIVNEYFESLSDYNRAYRTREIERLQADLYTDELIRKYPLGRMPVRVMFEVLSFGAFINFYLYCTNRWHDREMKAQHYLLRQAKAVRNAVAHSSDIINGFASNNSHIHTAQSTNETLQDAGISRSTRRNKMRNPRIQQIVMLLHAYRLFTCNRESMRLACMDAHVLSSMMHEVEQWSSNNDAVRSSFTFLRLVLDNGFLE